MKISISLPVLAVVTLLHITPALAQFSVIALHDGSPVHLQPITANNLALWLIKSTSSFCPLPASDCPSGTDTVFSGGESTLLMDVEVPGGQQGACSPRYDIFPANSTLGACCSVAYVNTDGSIGYTVAHSAIIPAGANTTGFDTSGAGSLDLLGVTAFGATGFVACPTDGAYQIFANIPGVAADCVGFDAAMSLYTAPAGSSGYAAWEYT